jgi:hypothetical protein
MQGSENWALNTSGTTTELSRSWEAASRLATQEFPNILWHGNVHYLVHQSPPLLPVVSQINPVPITPSLGFILMSFSHLRLSLPSGLLLLAFTTKSYKNSSPMLAIRPVHLILFDVIILSKLGGEYKLWSTALCASFLPFHPFSVQIFFSAPCSQIPSVYVLPLMADTKFHTHAKHRQNHSFMNNADRRPIGIGCDHEYTSSNSVLTELWIYNS